MAKIIVTGATSFIGVHLIEELLKKQQEVWAVVRPNSKNIRRLLNFKNLHIVECSLENIEDLVYYISDKCDVFYHLAWEGARAPFRDDKLLQENNYQAALKTFNIAKKMGCNKFVGAGSQAEYGKTIGHIDEEYTESPLTEYGKAKLKASREIRRLGEKNTLHVIWPRIFSVYGQYDYSETLIMNSIQKMKHNEDVELSFCIQNWNYIYVKDVAIMFRKIGLNSCEDGVYNLASFDNRTLKSYVKELKRIIGSDSNLQFGKVPYRQEGMISFVPKINKFMHNFSEMQFTAFQEGIRQILKI